MHSGDGGSAIRNTGGSTGIRHPEYVHRNRELQRERNRRRRKVPDQSAGGCKEIAKMDAFGGAMSFASGLYRLTPVDPPGIAKMDALTVRLALICPVAGGGVR